jgi:IMP dehydrogenase
MSFQPVPSYSYDDLGLKPIYGSTINHREDVDTSIDFLGIKLEMPLVSAPMNAVTGTILATELRKLGGLGFLPRTSNFEKDLSIFENSPEDTVVSIPATGDYLERAEKYLEKGAKRFCIDVANGFHTLTGEAVGKLRKFLEQVNCRSYIITGNVASWEGFKYLSDCGADAVRCGISNGAVCSTALATKVGVGSASLIREIAEKQAENPDYFKTDLIADGGIKNPGDVSLAIALGAKVVMSGSIFAGSEESPGDVLNYNGNLFKHYSGQASKYVKGNSKFVEGADTLVAYKGPLKKIWESYKNGLQSSMAYMDSRTICEHRYLDTDCFVFLHHAARFERGIYAK